MPFPIRRFDQVALVIRDIDAAMEGYWRTLGVGPWQVWKYDSTCLDEMTYRGAPADFAMYVGIAYVGATMVELIEPIVGPSVYTEHLDRKGEGLHHVAQFVPSLDDALEAALARNMTVLQSGRGFGADRDGGFVYFDTEAELGLIFELVQLPRRRLPPLKSYPLNSASTAAQPTDGDASESQLAGLERLFHNFS